MSVPTLPLAFVGWFFAILSFAALSVGVLLLRQLFRSGKIPPAYLRSRIIGDFALLAIWLIGLVSAFGLLNDISWGRAGLEFFCWVLIALCSATIFTLRAEQVPLHSERTQAR